MPVAGRLHPAVYGSPDDAHVEGLARALATIFTHRATAELFALPPDHRCPGIETVVAQLIVLSHISGMLPSDIIKELDPEQGVQSVPVPDIVNLLRQTPLIDPVHDKHSHILYYQILKGKFAQYTLSSPSSQVGGF